MKRALRTIRIIGLLVMLTNLSLLAIFRPAPIDARSPTCTASSDKPVVSPDEKFNITVDFSDDKPHLFNYQLLGTSISDYMHGTTDPYTFQLTAPDQYFSGVKISELINSILFPICTANVISSLPPPTNICSFTFNPKEIGGGQIVTATAENTTKDYIYATYIDWKGANQEKSESIKSPGGPLTFKVNAPNNHGIYRVTVIGQPPNPIIQQLQSCVALEGINNLIVTSDGPGKNPCKLNPATNKIECPTALGNIPTTIQGFAGRILQIAIGLAGGLALILMVIGSIRVLTSSGDQQKLSAGRDMIVAAIAGLLFLIFSVLILQFIGVQILNIPFT